MTFAFFSVAARAALIAARNGSINITMPGPPPKGRSSTRRYGSVVKSRGFQDFTSSKPRSSARPTTPIPAHCAMKSGNSVMTSMRIPHPLKIWIPIHRYFGILQINGFDELALHEGNQAFARRVLHYHHVVGTGREQVAYTSQRHAVVRDNREVFEIGPVVFALRGFGQCGSRNPDRCANQRCRRVGVVVTGEPTGQTLSLFPAFHVVHVDVAVGQTH